MRGRLLLLSFSVLMGLGSSTFAANLNQQRAHYDAAKAALAKGDASVYQRYQHSLRDYPLEPHLAYDELTLRLKTASNAEIEKFLAEHGDLPQIGWMKLRWLRWLAERGDWKTFLNYYDPSLNFTELDCLYAQYHLTQGNRQTGAAAAQKLWLVGKSQPNACDPMFEAWKAQGHLTEQLRWERTLLAVEARNEGLASYLVRQLTSLKAEGELLLEVAKNPAIVAQTQRFSTKNSQTAQVASLGLRRLARQNPERALELLPAYEHLHAFNERDKTQIAREVGLTLARRFDARGLEVMAKYDPNLLDNTVTEWRMRLLLRLQRYQEAAALAQRLPQELASTNRWKYWQARTLQLASNDARATLGFQALAKERDFYGFMAADHVKAPYMLNHRPLALDNKTVQKVRNTAGIRRAVEFHQRGQIVDGRREWYHVSRLFSREELVAQARLGYEMGWYFPAIRSISQAQYWDDLDVRFPMAHRNQLVQQANTRGIAPSWAFAITRQESGFMADARSHVGATGLMQLMPATAKETAKRYGIPLTNPNQVLIPEKNIQLGTAYLSQVQSQFGGNRILASAAYNAGPGRVRQWLRDADHLPYDIWIETIPFDETRSYVQNVLSYAVIYAQKLNAPQKLVAPHEIALSRP